MLKFTKFTLQVLIKITMRYNGNISYKKYYKSNKNLVLEQIGFLFLYLYT